MNFGRGISPGPPRCIGASDFAILSGGNANVFAPQCDTELRSTAVIGSTQIDFKTHCQRYTALQARLCCVFVIRFETTRLFIVTSMYKLGTKRAEPLRSCASVSEKDKLRHHSDAVGGCGRFNGFESPIAGPTPLIARPARPPALFLDARPCNCTPGATRSKHQPKK